jgi:hypothetical protein
VGRCSSHNRPDSKGCENPPNQGLDGPRGYGSIASFYETLPRNYQNGPDRLVLASLTCQSGDATKQIAASSRVWSWSFPWRHYSRIISAGGVGIRNRRMDVARHPSEMGCSTVTVYQQQFGIQDAKDCYPLWIA